MTVKRFVVGIDASEESTDALAWARSVAGPHDQITVVYAWELPLMTGYDMALPIEAVDIGEYSKQGLADLIAKIDDDRLQPVVREGHAGRAIVSEGEGADLEVVGRHGNSRVSMMLGSTANYVLHHTEVPVAVVRGGARQEIRRLIVGVDDHDLDEAGENESVRALRWAYQLAGVEEIRVQHAWFLPALAVGAFPAVATDFGQMDAAAQEVIDRVVAAAGPAPDGVSVVTEPVRGTPGFALIEASREADLVVMGSRGRGGFAGLLLGSTSAEVASHSHCLVVIVR